MNSIPAGNRYHVQFSEFITKQFSCENWFRIKQLAVSFAVRSESPNIHLVYPHISYIHTAQIKMLFID